MIAEAEITVRPGAVTYVDLCEHTEATKEEFFSQASLKTFTVYGLIMDAGDIVKVMYLDDESDNQECAGIVIPKDCVIDLVYLEDKQEKLKTGMN